MPPTSPGCPAHFAHDESRDQKYFVYFDDRGIWLHVSPGMTELLGYSYEDLVGNSVAKLQPPDLQREAFLLEAYLVSGYLDTVYAVRHRDRNVIGFRVICKRLRDGCNLAIWQPL